MTIAVTLFSDPACPWAYSANPALTTLRWRYGDQLDWRLVTIGLTEHAREYGERGYTPVLAAQGYRRFRRFGMPFAGEPKKRVSGSSRACRAVVAARLAQPGSEWAVFRALQFAWFTTTLQLDEEEALAEVLAPVPGVDGPGLVEQLDDPAVTSAYEADKAEARSAAGSPTAFQGKAKEQGGSVRYTAPSLIFANGSRSLEAGGFQPVEAYDVLVANLDPALRREQPPEDPGAVVERFPLGLTTQELAAAMTAGDNSHVPDREAAEAALIGLVGEGRVERLAMGDDALWRPVKVRAAEDTLAA